MRLGFFNDATRLPSGPGAGAGAMIHTEVTEVANEKRASRSLGVLWPTDTTPRTSFCYTRAPYSTGKHLVVLPTATRTNTY